MDQIKHRVECFSGQVYAERPTAVWWQDERHEVEAIEASWRTPSGPAFRVSTQDGYTFELQYSEVQDKWSIRPA
jgi:hypothetical protein